MRATKELVITCGGEVVAFIAPYMIEGKEGKMLCGDLSLKSRYLCTQLQAEQAMIDTNPKIMSYSISESLVPWTRDIGNELAMIFPPSLYMYDRFGLAVPIKWGEFAKSSNIWFDSSHITDKNIMVFLDPSNARESFDVLQLLSIIHRKDPKSVTVVIPFLEQSTQDRVEYDEEWESLAMVDTIAKVLGKNKVITFDLHAEQTRFAFHDLCYDNLVKVLWNKYRENNENVTPVFPDDGAYKRYASCLGPSPQKVVKDSKIEPIVFRKTRDGEKRIVTTDGVIRDGKYVIIDDIVRSGGTMHEVAKYLLSHGASKVDALFTHAPLEKSACKNMEIFNEIWTTNTCPGVVPRNWVKLDVYSYLINKYGKNRDITS